MLYALAHALLRVLFRLFCRWEVFGRENVPESGGVIIAPNHESFLDPMLVGTSLPRPVHYLARRDLFSPGPWGWILRRVRAVPVERASPTPASIRSVLDLIRSGAAMAIFPEGTRGNGVSLGKGKAGMGMLALRAGVPVVPLYIQGSGRVLPRSARLPRPGKIRLFYGAPLVFPRPDRPARADYEEVSRKVIDAIARLRAFNWPDKYLQLAAHSLTVSRNENSGLLSQISASARFGCVGGFAGGVDPRPAAVRENHPGPDDRG